MSLIRWQPMQELDVLRRQMDQLFEGLTVRDFPALSMNGETKWIRRSRSKKPIPRSF